MATKVRCAKCGYGRFSYHYRAARPGWRFLFWSEKAKPECIMLWCLGCGYEDERPELVGKIISHE